MNDIAFFSSPIFNWVIMPFLIFLARICDVSIGTVKIMLMTRGNRMVAPILAFFEISIWLLAIRQIIFHLTNWACYFAFAGGFAVGSYVGIILEERLAFGQQVIRIITQKDAKGLIDSLRRQGFGVTTMAAQGSRGPVEIIFTIIYRRDQKAVLKSIEEHHSQAFYTIEDIRSVRSCLFSSGEQDKII